jgi:hypothetical protein
MTMRRSDSSEIAGGIPAIDSDWHIGAYLTYIDVSAWTRLAEVDAYARGRDISRQVAIQELVYVGLSHEASHGGTQPIQRNWLRC